MIVADMAVERSVPFAWNPRINTPGLAMLNVFGQRLHIPELRKGCGATSWPLAVHGRWICSPTGFWAPNERSETVP